MKSLMVRIFISIPLIIWGLLTIAWGIFCTFGGPDPGAGSGNEGMKWGLGFITLGLLLFSIGKYIWDKSKGKF